VGSRNEDWLVMELLLAIVALIVGTVGIVLALMVRREF
jgi:hypothetical protein